MYALTGTLTFSNNAARNAAETALAVVVDGVAATELTGATYPPGRVRGGTGELTVAFQLADEATAVTVLGDLLTSLASWPRSAGHLSISRLDT